MANSASHSEARAHGMPRGAFTIVELLVVVAIISVLVGLLLPALSGVQRRSRKSTELNNIKHVNHAWMLYANNNNDAALPGFLEQAVQAAPVPGTSRGWGVTYDYPDRTKIPIDATNIAGPWTWRLISYLDYNHEMMHAHLGEADADKLNMIGEADKIAYEPAFGYNGYYIGGYWAMLAGSSPQYAVPKFYNDCAVPTPGNPKVPLVIPTTIAQIRRSSDVVVFSAATKIVNNPQPFYSSAKLPADTPGACLVGPPTIGTTPQWKPLDEDPINAFQVLAPGDVYVPLGRHTGTIALVYADGHTDSQGYNALFDQRKWIDGAASRTYMHQPCP